MFWWGTVVATLMIASFVINVMSDSSPSTRLLACTFALLSSAYVIVTLVQMGGI